MFLQFLFYFGWGAGHALQPGHGKAIISAYMVGAAPGRKPARAVLDAVILGLVTAATHTVVVYAIALVVRLAGRLVDETLLQGVTSIVGASLVILVGAWMLRERIREHARRHGAVDHHGRPVEASHGHDHAHLPAWAEKDDGSRPVRRLIALGISGGVVPCRGALLIYFGGSAAAELFDELADPLAALAVYSLGIAATMIAVALFAVFFSKTVERLAARFRGGKNTFWDKLYRLLWWAGPVVVLGVGAYLLLYSFNYL